ncbi:hypothetical protein [Komagataeibacter sp. FXV3]|uniref:hypothetical protein n=1 Tax=Komagataeibacter sp. FXV3 TaxID=2608998 RepID=UPI00187BB02A|nr:hypothetical protein [Komagataeibacter sp. FXV3]MBE7730267.1 hypothetical protein [Komagataeibacter sp. FXV3]
MAKLFSKSFRERRLFKKGDTQKTFINVLFCIFRMELLSKLVMQFIPDLAWRLDVLRTAVLIHRAATIGASIMGEAA